MGRTAKLIASVCIAALALGACGSSYNGLTKAEFVKQAVAICKTGDTKLAAFGKSIGSNPTITQIKKAYADSSFPR